MSRIQGSAHRVGDTVAPSLERLLVFGLSERVACVAAVAVAAAAARAAVGVRKCDGSEELAEVPTMPERGGGVGESSRGDGESHGGGGGGSGESNGGVGVASVAVALARASMRDQPASINDEREDVPRVEEEREVPIGDDGGGGGGGSGGGGRSSRKLSIDFFLEGESVKTNPYLAAFAASGRAYHA